MGASSRAASSGERGTAFTAGESCGMGPSVSNQLPAVNVGNQGRETRYVIRDAEYEMRDKEILLPGGHRESDGCSAASSSRGIRSAPNTSSAADSRISASQLNQR